MLGYQFKEKLTDIAGLIRTSISTGKSPVLAAKMNSPVRRVKLVGLLRRICEARGLVTHEITLTSQLNILDQIEKQTEQAKHKIDAIFIHGFDISTRTPNADEKISKMLTEFAENIDQLTVPVMFWFPTYTIDMIYRKTDAFWNLIENRVIQFKAADALPKETEYATDSYENSDARHKRIDTLEVQLNDLKKNHASAYEFTYVLQLLAKNYFDDGQFEKAFEAYSESYTQLSPDANPLNRASILHQIGVIYHLWGRYDKAEANYLESIRMKAPLNDQAGIAGTNHQLGLLYQDMGEFDKAIEYYKKSIDINRNVKFTKGIANSLVNLGSVYQEVGLYLKAVENYREAFELYQTLSHSRGMAVSLCYTANVYEEKNIFKDAIKYYTAALSLLRKMNSTEFNSVNQALLDIQEQIGKPAYDGFVSELQRPVANK